MAIRYKMAAVMAPLLVTCIVVLGLEVRTIERETDEVRRQTELAVAADGPIRLLNSVQDERNWAVIELIGLGGQIAVAVEGYEETRRRTDQALVGFEDLLASSAGQTREAYAPAMGRLATNLEAVRGQIDSSPFQRNVLGVGFGNQIFDAYSLLIEPFFASTTQIAQTIEQASLRQGAELIDLSSRQVETIASLARETILTSLFTEGGINEPDEVSEISGLLWRFRQYAVLLQSRTVGLYERTATDELFVGFTEALTDQVNLSMRGRFDPVAFLEIVDVRGEESYLSQRERTSQILRAEAEDISDAVIWRERAYLFFILLTVSVTVIVMLAVSWSITRPLQTLKREAAEIAGHRLNRVIAEVLRTPRGEDVIVPQVESVGIATSGEIADVASALDTVQDSALQLAVGEAVLRRNLADAFANLARRNQNLLGRQLDFITRLERDEADPETLHHLFQLDHLATRMRRNAESLLVLAGSETPRKWAAPVPLNGIIRAALSEVLDYQRVRIWAIEPIIVVGYAAADLVHVLAELLENALVFSHSDTDVEVRGLTQPAGYTLAIVDSGVGMAPNEIALANRRLAGAESFTVAPSKYMGHYVAGTLALRHNIHIRLQPSVGTGTTATVHIPAGLVASDDSMAIRGEAGTQGHISDYRSR